MTPISNSLSAAVTTSTIGRETLAATVESVLAQSYPCTHYVFVNGPGFEEPSLRILHPYRQHIVLIRNGRPLGYDLSGKQLGASGTYASSYYLVREDVVFHLDDDNWFERDHVGSLMDLIVRHELPWAYSLRKICDRQGQYLCEDDCESLGRWPAFQGNYHLIDQNCLAIRRHVGQRIAPSWMQSSFSADRGVTETLMQHFPRYGTTGKSTVNYRIGLGSNQVTDQFFTAGNAVHAERYNGIFPWRRECTF